MQKCKCINTNCKDISKIKSALLKSGIIHQPDNINGMIKNFLKIDIPVKFVDNSIYLYENENSDYITVIAEDAIVSPELACILSDMLNCICIFSAFIENAYELYVFKNNNRIFRMQKDKNSFSYSNIDDLYAECENNLSKKQFRKNINAICNSDDIENSFCKLEYVFGTVLTMGYNYMTKQNIKMLEEDGSVYIIK